MSKSYKSFKLVCALMALVILFTSVSFNAYAARNFQAEIDAYQAKIDAANSKKSDQQKSVDELQSDISLLQEQVDVYQDKIDSLNSEIAEKNALISQYENEISSLQTEIEQTNAKIDDINRQIENTYEIIKERMRASYMAGDTSTLEIILGSMNYEDFLTRLELVSAVTKHDNEVIKGLENDIAQLNELLEATTQKKSEQEEKKAAVEAEKAEIVSKRSDVQASKNAVTSKQSNMESKVDQINNLISKLEQNTAEYQAAIAKIKADQEAYDRSLAAKASASGSNGTGTVNSSGWQFPLRCKYYVSQHYGHNGHKGVDLAGCGGQPVYAVAAGKVLSAEYHSSWGYNVLIDHGNGVWTRYAHMVAGSLSVSKGQTVSAGQQLGIVGSTGNSTGPHLHFEVWVNKNNKSERINPEPYIGL